ncbi:CapA family protein [Bacillus sp. 31A1R]|uniref:CapA family protein n=2 Tax=Robertmurraya mangrovi TaxID=3098077 RepID=A0ABU5J539_9BACI|nr:CapA family protein [Bacillus sp. 31A1R]
MSILFLLSLSLFTYLAFTLPKEIKSRSDEVSVASENKKTQEDSQRKRKEDKAVKEDKALSKDKEKKGNEKQSDKKVKAKEDSKDHLPIELVFVGDLLMDWSTKITMDSKGVDYPFVHVKEAISKADLAIANLENPLTTRNESFKDKNQLYNFQAKPEHIKGVINTGFDLVSLANNHALDYGEEGLLDTFATLEHHKLDYIGAGRTMEEAFQTKEYVIKGKKIRIMAASRFVPAVSWYTFAPGTKAGLAGAYDLEYLVKKVAEEKVDTDYLFLFIHWGIEKTFTPADYQKIYVQRLVEAGVDGIIGSHPHVLQGFEYYNNVPIAYSLGNFLFPNYVKGDTAETGLLTLTIQEGNVNMAFKPYYIKDDQITPLSLEEEKKILNKLASVSYNVQMNGYDIQRVNE